MSDPRRMLATTTKKGAAMWTKLRGTVRDGRVSAEAVALSEMFDMERVGEHFGKRLELNYRAWSRYMPRAYPGRVTVLRARARRLWQVTGRGPGLRELAAGGVVVRTLPGNHDSILKEPVGCSRIV